MRCPQALSTLRMRRASARPSSATSSITSCSKAMKSRQARATWVSGWETLNITAATR